MKLPKMNCAFNMLTIFKMLMIFHRPTQELGFHVILSEACDPIGVCSLMLKVPAKLSTLEGCIQTIIAASAPTTAWQHDSYLFP